MRQTALSVALTCGVAALSFALLEFDFRPVLVGFHGGFFVTADRVLEEALVWRGRCAGVSFR